MTEFRRRKDDGRVFPVRKKAYGISRQLAYADVQALRKDGKRARLIKTNQRLDLFAPYESVLPPGEVVPNNTASPGHETTPATPAQVNPIEPTKSQPLRNIAQGKMDALKLIGLIGNGGKLSMTNKQLRDFFVDAKITVSDGVMKFMSVDPAQIVMMDETLPTSLPDGDYHVEQMEDKSFTLESGIDRAAANLKAPKLDYENAWKTQIDGEALTRLMNFLTSSGRKGDPYNDVVQFVMKGNRIKVNARKVNEDGSGATSETLFEIHAQPPRRGEDSKVDYDQSALFPREYLGNLLKTMLGKKTVKGKISETVSLELRPDYPISVYMRRLGQNDERVEVHGLVAPRMGD